MPKQPLASDLSLALAVSSALDLISPRIVNHHRRVAFIAYLIGVELKLPLPRLKDLVLAGLFHDIGAFSLQERLDTLSFEIVKPNRHAEIGYRLLRDFGPFVVPAGIIRYHHVPWRDGNGAWIDGNPVPLESHILHLADRIAVLIPEQSRVLEEVPAIAAEIGSTDGSRFRPDLMEAFDNLCGKEFFWLDAASLNPLERLASIIVSDSVELDIDSIVGFGQLLARVIDFRSPFTATHSAGVAASAEILARLSGFSDEDQVKIRVAGYLHDLGKLAVPTEVLEKAGALSGAEWNVIHTHTYFGFRTLQKVPAMETLNVWGSLHHEMLDGSGYPFHLTAKDLPRGARIMAVADIFSALAEDRPYRKGMARKEAVEIVERKARDGLLDREIVDTLDSNLDEIDEVRQEKTLRAMSEYDGFFSDIA
jgi:HD-GYP domain-containing protein (c-di-GMP phosphodiesterase class II)